MATVINGSDLMLFIGGKSIAFATNHTLTINVSTVETTSKTKDEIGGGWVSNKPQNTSWEISTDNLYSIDGEGQNFADLFDAVTNGTELTGVFMAISRGTGVPTGGYVPGTTAGQVKYTGTVIVTNLTLNAQDGENATFSATFQGVGQLTKTVVA